MVTFKKKKKKKKKKKNDKLRKNKNCCEKILFARNTAKMPRLSLQLVYHE